MTDIDWPEVEGANYTRDDEAVAAAYEEAAEEFGMDVEEVVEDVLFVLDQREDAGVGGAGAISPGADAFTAGDEEADWRLEALRVWKTIQRSKS